MAYKYKKKSSGKTISSFDAARMPLGSATLRKTKKNKKR